MSEHEIGEGAGHLDLGDGYVLHPSTLRGTVHVQVAGASRALATGFIEASLARAGMRLDKVIELPPAAPEGTRALRTGDVPAGDVQLDVATKEGEACVLLSEDLASGALSWILPDNRPVSPSKTTSRGLAIQLRFTIPLARPAHAEGARAFAGLVGAGKKLKAFFYEITDAVIGPIIRGFARKWESKHRPNFVRTFGPNDYQVDQPDFPRLSDADWRRLTHGRALLFVHGTFSTSGVFASLPAEMIAELSRRYDGRMFAFNHPTLAVDPRENAIAFLADIPDGVKLDIDIVCHSRGGLVARQIAALGALGGEVKVRRIVFVGATNAGTVLADDEHMIGMIDRFTTIANFIPHGTVRQVVDALALVVKVLGHGLLSDLEGLRAMNPRGEFMKALNVAGGPGGEYYAITSDFEPKADTPFFSLTRVSDVTIDRVFESVPNDLVVPHDGVFDKNGAAGFPIAAARCLKFGPGDAVIHTEFFTQPRTAEKLLEWLEPAAMATRSFASPSMAEVARAMDAIRDHALAMLASSGSGRSLGEREVTFTPDELETLRPHVVNLSEGVFKESGIYSTSASDVDAMVHEHIPAWIRAQPADHPLRVVVWAHGGLVGERAGIEIARKHIEWWKKNGVYPIYIVWETGLFDALRSILESVARKIPGLGARDFFDYSTDPLVQEGVRALGGVHVWGAMKRNAELASGPDGGARYLAKQLRELAAKAELRESRTLELHAVGHSAGSIFHSWFIPMANELEVPAFTTLQLLAPAITVADFETNLLSRIGAGKNVERVVMYTMKRHFEERDNCIGVYRKSLLYLIHHGLEPQRRTPVLGLEISARTTPSVASLFGLNGATGAPGRVVWSQTEADGRSSSRSKQHGAFDDDPLTMNSVAANVLGAAQVRVPYRTDESRSVDSWPVADEWLARVDVSAIGPGISAIGKPNAGLTAPQSIVAPSSEILLPAVSRPVSRPVTAAGPAPAAGARRAFCVGIDAYPDANRLTGCVNDAELWTRTLESVGFDVMKPLLDENATRERILSRLSQLATESQRGDVLVFHFSGHGVSVEDFDGDEDDGTDEAFVPFDFEEGAFLIDDDVRAVCNKLPPGVNLTIFSDCCFSGTNTRMFARKVDTTDRGGVRELRPTAAWEDWMRAHERFRQHESSSRGMMVRSRGTVDVNAISWVNFSACNSSEKAREHDGNGDFTRIATTLIGSSEFSRFTHRSFQDALITRFGDRRQQTPQLDCPDALINQLLLRPI